MRLVALSVALLAATPTFASDEVGAGPKLIVAISVDQFSADLFSEYRPLYVAGLRRLEGGAVFPSGYQSHAATETCPGHSTILTGSHPGRTGIVANEWYDQTLGRPDKKVYCAEDPAVPGSSSSSYSVSAQFLKARTLGDRMKAADPRTRVVAVAGKDRAAIMMGGHAIDEAWYWGGKSFVTLPGVERPAPKIVDKVNADVATAIARIDAPLLPAPCKSRSVPVAVGAQSVGVLRERKPGDYTGFRTTLAFDRAVTDVAIGLIRELHLGAGPARDLIAIGLSATDYVGHTFGTEGAEMCAQVLGVDESVGRILAALDATHVPYVVVLTADHGGHDLPERVRSHGIPDASRVDPALAPGVMGKLVAAEFNLSGPALVGVGPFGDIYLARDVPPGMRIAVLEAARAHYAAHPQVAAVYTAAELRRLPGPTGPVDEWTLSDRVRSSFDPERSGDLVVVLKPHVTPVLATGPYVATHGSPWNYDRRVPVLFYGAGIGAFEQSLPIETVDILPTLAAMISLAVPPSEIDGRCVELAVGASACAPK